MVTFHNEWFLYNYGMLQLQSIQRIGCINILLESVLCSKLADPCGFAREYKATGYPDHVYRIQDIKLQDIIRSE